MLTPLERARLDYSPRFPEKEVFLKSRPIDPDIQRLFPLTSQRGSLQEGEKRALRVGVLFSGGQAPGGHNVVTGLYDALMDLNPQTQLIGFLDGPSGLIGGKAIVLDESSLAPFRNQGGFHLLGSGRTKIEVEEQFAKVRRVVEEMNLDGLIIIGGDDSNTNAAYLAEDFVKHQIECTVVGVPKTIDGDLKSPDIELTFGYDTATKVYSEWIGNLAVDLLSAKKMWAFVKLMGRSASHVTLECALSTQPNYVLISEEKKALSVVVREIADLIEERHRDGKNYGLILIPEGIIENFSISETMDAPRDPHGNIEVAKIETERFLISQVQEEMKRRNRSIPFHPQPFFFGYEGRAALPTNFDANYGYSLGRVAAFGVAHRAQGCIASLSDLHLPPEEWNPSLVPILSLMGFEIRKGQRVAVILKTLVDLQGAMYNHYLRESPTWRIEDRYLSPGPIQFFGPGDLTERPPWALNIR